MPIATLGEDVPAYTRPPTAMSTAHSVDYLTASGRDHAPCRPQSMWMHQIRLGNEIPPIHLHICGGALSGMVIEKRRYGRRRLYATTTTTTTTITSIGLHAGNSCAAGAPTRNQLGSLYSDQQTSDGKRLAVLAKGLAAMLRSPH